MARQRAAHVRNLRNAFAQLGVKGFVHLAQLLPQGAAGGIHPGFPVPLAKAQHRAPLLLPQGHAACQVAGAHLAPQVTRKHPLAGALVHVRLDTQVSLDAQQHRDQAGQGEKGQQQEHEQPAHGMVTGRPAFAHHHSTPRISTRISGRIFSAKASYCKMKVSVS